MAGNQPTVGFIGLGQMGRGMAANMLRQGVDIIVHDAAAGAMQPLVADGARAAASVADLAQRADVVFTSLPGPVEVEAVALAGGLVDAARPGLAWFDLSTSSRALALRLEAAFRERGAAMLDAPVAGDRPGPLPATSCSGSAATARSSTGTSACSRPSRARRATLARSAPGR